MNDNDAIFQEFLPEPTTTTGRKFDKDKEAELSSTPVVFKEEDLLKYGLAKPIRKHIIGKISYDPD